MEAFNIVTADALVSAELGKPFPIPAKYLLKHNQQISQQNSHYQVAREYRSSRVRKFVLIQKLNFSAHF